MGLCNSYKIQVRPSRQKNLLFYYEKTLKDHVVFLSLFMCFSSFCSYYKQEKHFPECLSENVHEILNWVR